jgi:hypothetical protein
VCAPYTALSPQYYKHRVKLTPGTGKKGKMAHAVRKCVCVCVCEKGGGERDREGGGEGEMELLLFLESKCCCYEVEGLERARMGHAVGKTFGSVVVIITWHWIGCSDTAPATAAAPTPPHPQQPPNHARSQPLTTTHSQPQTTTTNNHHNIDNYKTGHGDLHAGPRRLPPRGR